MKLIKRNSPGVFHPEQNKKTTMTYNILATCTELITAPKTTKKEKNAE